MVRAAICTWRNVSIAAGWSIAAGCLLACGLTLQPGSVAAQTAGVASVPTASEQRVAELASARLSADLDALAVYRPSYPFWRHIFAIPDGAVAFGSATDGRLLAVFRGGDWTSAGRWEDDTLAGLLEGQPLSRLLDQRRDEVAQLLAGPLGPVVHNPTRGLFLLPNVPRYGVFLDEWAAIYERFGVPAELGLAQAVIESGLSGTIKSEARAIGFCQWLQSNWNHLKKLSPHVIEAENQTTQAPYCAAYLTILATRYGSYVPALSEHHAGGTNVGRILINGAWLGGSAVQEQYFKGSQFALAVRNLPEQSYSELYRTYGPRSFRYTELVFGNMPTIAELRLTTPQQRIHAMRTTRSIALAELTRRTGLGAAELKRYNPALKKQVPARATVYLPRRVAELGTDVTFWHRAANEAFAGALADFLALGTSPNDWDEPAFQPTLREFRRRFEQSRSEEGTIMSTVLAYFMDDVASTRRTILQEYRSSAHIAQLFERAVVATAAASQQP